MADFRLSIPGYRQGNYNGKYIWNSDTLDWSIDPADYDKLKASNPGMTQSLAELRNPFSDGGLLTITKATSPLSTFWDSVKDETSGLVDKAKNIVSGGFSTVALVAVAVVAVVLITRK